MKIFDKFIEIKQLPYIISGLIFVCSLGFLHTNMEKDKNQNLIMASITFGHLMSQSSDDLTNRCKVRGKSVRASLETDVFTTAKLRLADKIKKLKQSILSLAWNIRNINLRSWTPQLNFLRWS